jgi:four helix bundle protein
MSKGYEDLRVWREAIKMAKFIYRITKTFPKSETYGLTSQMQRCAVSIASNIAEGASRSSPKEFKYFLSIAIGSLAELHTQCIIAHDDYISDEQLERLTLEITNLRKMLNGLKSKLAARNAQLETENVV